MSPMAFPSSQPLTHELDEMMKREWTSIEGIGIINLSQTLLKQLHSIIMGYNSIVRVSIALYR